jgi:hypothetical protein
VQEASTVVKEALTAREMRAVHIAAAEEEEKKEI